MKNNSIKISLHLPVQLALPAAQPLLLHLQIPRNILMSSTFRQTRQFVSGFLGVRHSQRKRFQRNLRTFSRFYVNFQLQNSVGGELLAGGHEPNQKTGVASPFQGPDSGNIRSFRVEIGDFELFGGGNGRVSVFRVGGNADFSDVDLGGIGEAGGD